MQKHSNYYFLYTLDTHCITVLHFHFKHFIEIFLGIHINVFNKSIAKPTGALLTEGLCEYCNAITEATIPS